MECKICNKICNSDRSMSRHIKNTHNMTLLYYLCEYENFLIPTCKICNKPAKYLAGRRFAKTCGDRLCINKTSVRPHTSESKAKMRKYRLEYMRKHPENTAWRLGNKPSYPEKHFMGALKQNGYLDKFEVVREKCFFPYYADFAFVNAKVVVEIDGSQHKHRIKEDVKKDKLIQSMGWRVYRVSAGRVLGKINEVLKELDGFIGDIDCLGITSEIITDKQLKEEKRLLAKKKKLDDKTLVEDKRKQLILNCGIDFSVYGWRVKLGRVLGVSSVQSGRWVRIKMPELYKKCYGKSRVELMENAVNKKRISQTIKTNKKLNIDTRKQLILNSDIDFSMYGWHNKLCKELGLKNRNNVTRWVKRHMPDFYAGCYSRAKDNNSPQGCQFMDA